MTIKMHPGRIRCLFAVLLACACTPVVSGDLSLTTGLDISSGKYGGSDSTIVRYLPFIVKYELGRSTFKATLPYVSITSPSGGVTIDADGNVISTGGVGPRVTQSGPGDMVATYTYSVIEQPRHGWLVDLSAKVKLPTGDEDKGLSTGERDYSLLADFYYPAGKFTPFMTVGYRMPGNPPGASLQNAWMGSLGVGYKHSATNSAGLILDARQASSAGGVAPRDLTAYWVHKFNPQTKFQVYLVGGLSDASADYGIGAMLTHKY